MSRLRPGWLVAFTAALVVVSAWLPWLTVDGQRASAVGGVVGGDLAGLAERLTAFGVGQSIVLLAACLIVAGAMAAQGLSARLASTAALAISVLLVVLTVWYYRLYVYGPVSVGWGWYVGGATAVAAVLTSVWAMVAAWPASTPAPNRS
ncbi:hypothetical protein MHAS_03427 [Mycolicibacterium hassiacum DSM 44199]|uniref:hypothetical protein n=1 Tax=Mycolicibacterium hassiacum TaxID=46351 RepID=UPI000476F016|nr:hypothetical protein [Mycolicibacterium hassiacum]MDA4084880.1 membrane protein [Mycolicibacterium hassiacum DSM 44199]VCT91708.1 hypothetical protein MHAS_03427 [Mycolicibacterium hassiacum DSM 44199]